MPDRLLLFVIVLCASALAAVVAYEIWRKHNDPRSRRSDSSGGAEGSAYGARDRDGDDDGGGDGGGGGD
jgi:uncharacterized membrane protein YgcG